MSATILLVEDDAAARLALSKTLEHGGYLVHAAHNGTIALNLLTQHRFDVVVSDIRLPDIDGIQVLKAAVGQPTPPSVLLLTGYGTLDSAITALRLGANDYLLKPCAPRALLEGVSKAIERRNATIQHDATLRGLVRDVAHIQRQLQSIGAGASEEVELAAPVTIAKEQPDLIIVGHLHIGRFPHEAYYRNQPLHLTPIEHALLRCLAESSNSVVSYCEIVRSTHGYLASDSEAQTLLKSHVRNIRRKTDSDLIINIRNTGYRLSRL